MKSPDKHLVDVAVALVHREGRWLVARRPLDVHLPGKWEFPGGKSEPGESAEQTALRELAEECGVVAEAEARLQPQRFDYADRSVRLTPVLCRWRDGEAAPLGCQVCTWVELEALPKLDMPAGNIRIIRELGAMVGRSPSPSVEPR
jgi:8-oxo-dGTP diphosphatase